jgi:hypothetical protein
MGAISTKVSSLSRDLRAADFRFSHGEKQGLPGRSGLDADDHARLIPIQRQFYCRYASQHSITSGFKRIVSLRTPLASIAFWQITPRNRGLGLAQRGAGVPGKTKSKKTSLEKQ